MLIELGKVTPANVAEVRRIVEGAGYELKLRAKNMARVKASDSAYEANCVMMEAVILLGCDCYCI